MIRTSSVSLGVVVGLTVTVLLATPASATTAPSNQVAGYAVASLTTPASDCCRRIGFPQRHKLRHRRVVFSQSSRLNSRNVGFRQANRLQRLQRGRSVTRQRMQRGTHQRLQPLQPRRLHPKVLKRDKRGSQYGQPHPAYQVRSRSVQLRPRTGLH